MGKFLEFDRQELIKNSSPQPPAPSRFKVEGMGVWDGKPLEQPTQKPKSLLEQIKEAHGKNLQKAGIEHEVENALSTKRTRDSSEADSQDSWGIPLVEDSNGYVKNPDFLSKREKKLLKKEKRREVKRAIKTR